MSLRAALQPFADLARDIEAEHPGWYHDSFRLDGIGIKLAPFIAARAALEQNTSEPGWLIESALSAEDEPIFYAAFGNPRLPGSWTTFPLEAIRFATEEDAMKLSQRLFPDVEVRVRQHNGEETPSND